MKWLFFVLSVCITGIFLPKDVFANDTMFLQTATGTSYIIRACASPASDPLNIAQTASGTGRTLDYFDVWLSAPNAQPSNTLTWSLQGVTAGMPNGVSYSTGTINQNSLTADAASYRIAMTPAYTMVSSTSYALVMSCQNTDNNSNYRVNTYGTPVSQYSLGSAWYQEAVTFTWMQPDGNTYRDINISMYETYVTSTGATSTTTTTTDDIVSGSLFGMVMLFALYCVAFLVMWRIL